MFDGKPWVGVDLDGTLAEYHGWVSPTHIGEPVENIVNLVQHLMANGYEVKVFTARMATPWVHQQTMIRDAIKSWTKEHVGRELDSTCVKNPSCLAIFDDSAFSVEGNSGTIAGWDISSLFNFLHSNTSVKFRDVNSND